jgi:hypothetical protein
MLRLRGRRLLVCFFVCVENVIVVSGRRSEYSHGMCVCVCVCVLFLHHVLRTQLVLWTGCACVRARQFDKLLFHFVPVQES